MTLPRSELSETREAVARILVNVSILERVNKELLINILTNCPESIIPFGKPLQIPITFLFY